MKVLKWTGVKEEKLLTVYMSVWGVRDDYIALSKDSTAAASSPVLRINGTAW